MTTTSPTASAPAACRTGAAPDLPDAVGRDVIALSHTLHDAPELGFAEHRSVREIAAVLRAHERAVQVGAFGMETALLAAAGDPAGPTVAILAEYDALPDIGHGCGHNIIAASAVGAFLLAAQQVGAPVARWCCWALRPRRTAPARNCSRGPVRSRTSTLSS